MKFALNALPETFINMLQVGVKFHLCLAAFNGWIFQSLVSLRRIEKYLNAAEVTRVLPMASQSQKIAFQSCTVTWPQDRASSSTAPSAASTPKHKFLLVDLSLNFPDGELSLICGKLGSGKTLLLLGIVLCTKCRLLNSNFSSFIGWSRYSYWTNVMPAFATRFPGFFLWCHCSQGRLGCTRYLRLCSSSITLASLVVSILTGDI